MPQLSVTQALYDQLVQAFRQNPGNVKQAAELVGVNWKTANTAWSRGWPRKGWPAIDAVLKQEQIQARAQLQREKEAAKEAERADLEAARKQAIEAKKQEGQMTSLSRVQSLQNLHAAITLSRAATELAPALRARLQLETKKIAAWNDYEESQLTSSPLPAPSYPKPPMDPLDLTQLLRRVAAISRDIVSTAREAMEMERLYLGEPTNIIALVDEDKELSMEELWARREAALQALESAIEAGGVNEPAAGLDEPVIGQRVTHH